MCVWFLSGRNRLYKDKGGWVVVGGEMKDLGERDETETSDDICSNFISK